MKHFILFLFFTYFNVLLSQTVHFTISIVDSPKIISPYIFGANPEFTASEKLTARRLGGNRLTGYNWENNASNAGDDWHHSSDNYLTWSAGITNENVPGIVFTHFHNKAKNIDAYSLVTLQMAGYVAKDKNGSVSESETAPSSRWARVMFEKESAYSQTPDLNDTLVYMDEFVNYLVTQEGSSVNGGIRGYALDNEPALWPTTHPRIHPQKTTCTEVVQKGISLARAVKKVDSTAEIFGPVLYGFTAFYSFQDAPDWNTVKAGKSYAWFIDYYLDKMREAEQTYGKRLLDVLDVHWYPEAKGNTRITEANATSYTDNVARVQAPRTLWDPTYRENSWIAQYFSSRLPLIPKLLTSIKQYYPGTKLAFTEFSYGGENHITGAIATTDVLGIFAKYGIYLATYWPLSSNTSYIQAAYQMYRNYDGNGSAFGSELMPSHTSDSVNTSIYVARKTGSHQLHIIAINKNLTTETPSQFTIHGIASITQALVYTLDSSSAQIQFKGNVPSISNNTFSYTLPRASVCHFVVQTSPTLVEKQATVPTEFLLSAFPNPFNPATTLQFSVPYRSRILLKMYDILGREISTLVDNVYDQGNYSVLFDGKNFGSGVYIARIYTTSSNNELHTKNLKLVIMK